MKRFFTQNFTWKLLSLVTAAVLWVLVAREPEVATSISAPLLFKNIPADLDIASDVPERVHLEVRGMARRLTPEALSQAAVVLDLDALQPGERTFNIHDTDVRSLPIGVVFYRAVPSQVSMRFERLGSKDVPIEPTYSKSLADGYVVTGYGFSPPTVRIRGPEGRIRNIDHVVTDPIDLSGEVGHATRAAHIRLSDAHVRLESKSMVRFTVELQKLKKDLP